LRYLWARDRIAELSDFGDYNPPDESVRKIVHLGLKYNLLTQYTSFIAVREKVVNPDGSAEDVDQALPLPEGVIDTAVGSEPDLWWLLGATLLAVLIIAMRSRFQAIDVMSGWIR